MKDFKLMTFNASAPKKGAAFFILTRGENAGRPSEESQVNCIAFFCAPQDKKQFYWLLDYLWTTGAFKDFMEGKEKTPVLSINEAKKVIESADKVFKRIPIQINALERLLECELQHEQIVLDMRDARTKIYKTLTRRIAQNRN